MPLVLFRGYFAWSPTTFPSRIFTTRPARSATSRTSIAFSRVAWSRFPDPGALVVDAIREQYAVLFAAMPTPTFVIPGNVDMPEIWPEFTRPGVCAVDGKVVTIGGLRFGFVGGIPMPKGVAVRRGGAWSPHVLSAQEYAATVAGLAQIESLLDEFRQRGWYDEVCLIFTADRGLALGEHGIVGDYRPWLHDEVVRIPLLVRQPRGLGAGPGGEAADAQAVALRPALPRRQADAGYVAQRIAQGRRSLLLDDVLRNNVD